MSAVVITGAAGMTGAHLTRALLADGHSVTALDIVHPNDCRRLRCLLPEYWPQSSQFRYIWGSAGDFHALPPNATVIHLASVTDVRFASASPAYTAQLNIMTVARLLDECIRQEADQFILFSSHSVYGHQLRLPCPEDVPLYPSNHYGAVKAAAESLATAACREHGLPVTVLRPSLMFGEWERPGSLVSTFLRRAFLRQPITLDGGGQQARDLNYVGNTVDAVRTLIPLNPVPSRPQVLNIGSGHEVSIRQLAAYCCDAANVPFSDLCTDGPARAGEEGRLVLDPTRAHALLGKPRTSFEAGFSRTVDWVKGELGL